MDDYHVLVVDDDPDIRELITWALVDAGFAVEVASNAAAALDMLARSRPRLILLDLMMPVMTGWQVLQYLKGRRELRDIPVVVISADISPSPTLAILGAEEVFAKPFSVPGLIAIVEQWVGSGQAHSANESAVSGSPTTPSPLPPP